MDQQQGRLVCGRLLAIDKFALQICEQRIASVGCCDELYWVLAGTLTCGEEVRGSTKRFYPKAGKLKG